ncbi:hypothetical protein E2562_029634 [Oryza meyeriana var. granulata]|uniref:Uncharacterized protein n=1 Tax=Oryza meyeriana var. granulata TaxID=110450 RepID=A0A6G1E468_9ORYZ|nr:hypothetical protein E2562_029634 [Oryza meyeriana var. granulata]
MRPNLCLLVLLERGDGCSGGSRGGYKLRPIFNSHAAPLRSSPKREVTHGGGKGEEEERLQWNREVERREVVVVTVAAGEGEVMEMGKRKGRST